jgi:hypothetical protein
MLQERDQEDNARIQKAGSKDPPSLAQQENRYLDIKQGIPGSHLEGLDDLSSGVL